MTLDEFKTALASGCPEGTKLTVTITSDAIKFSAVPRNKDSDSKPTREFSTNESEIAAAKDTEPSLMMNAFEDLFPEMVAQARKGYEERAEARDIERLKRNIESKANASEKAAANKANWGAKKGK